MSRALPLLYAIQELNDALDEKLDAFFTQADLTLVQFNVMYLLVEHGSMRLSDLAQQKRCVKSNVTYLVKGMQTKGLVTLAADPNDGRARIITLTSEGRTHYRRAKNALTKIEKQLSQALGSKQIQQLTMLCLESAEALDAS